MNQAVLDHKYLIRAFQRGAAMRDHKASDVALGPALEEPIPE